jgi:peptide/nickel transport system permease protein
MLTAVGFPSARSLKPRTSWQRHLSIVIGAALLALMVGLAIAAPWLGTVDPEFVAPARRLRPSSQAWWFGTDHLGRDLYSRVLYGARASLIVGLAVAAMAMAAGLALGVACGFSRWTDGFVMRIMDGLMAIPAVLLAVALVALTKASIGIVVVAIAITEIPRVTRLVRSVVLQLREQPFILAAESVGTTTLATIYRHIVPNTLAPLIVQGTFVCSSAILTEAVLSFIGAGTPNNVATWGNIIAEGRAFFQIRPNVILFPALFLSTTVLAINLLGDGLRDWLDPRLSRQM